MAATPRMCLKILAIIITLKILAIIITLKILAIIITLKILAIIITLKILAIIITLKILTIYYIASYSYTAVMMILELLCFSPAEEGNHLMIITSYKDNEHP